ncbi:MAG: hypothetical protein ACI86H_002550 [bacterium]|jgi:hypothetical protein
MEKVSFLVQLDNYFEQQNRPENKLVQGGNKHVFEACMEHLDPILTFDEKMILMDYHVCYSKAFTSALTGNLDASQMWLNKAGQLPFFEKNTLQKIVEVNKFPAVAYHVYREGNYKKAIEFLVRSIKVAGSLVEEDKIEYMVWGQMEQYINIFRVHCANKDQAAAVLYAKSILLALVHAQHTKGTVENVSPMLLKKGEIDYISYATGDILSRLIKLEGVTIEMIVQEVFNPLCTTMNWSNCPLEGYKNAIFVLKNWVENDTDAMQKEFEDLLPNMNRQSNLLQFYLLEVIVPLIKNQVDNSDVKQRILTHIPNYYINRLNLDDTVLTNYSQFEFEMVPNN